MFFVRFQFRSHALTFINNVVNCRLPFLDIETTKKILKGMNNKIYFFCYNFFSVALECIDGKEKEEKFKAKLFSLRLSEMGDEFRRNMSMKFN